MSSTLKTSFDAAVDYLIDNLPGGDDPELSAAVYNQWPEELGGELVIYKRVSVEVTPEMKRTMTPADWEEFEEGTKRHWGAECHCTCCGETFVTGWFDNGIILREDGEAGWVPEDEGEIVNVGDEILTPCCKCEAKVMHQDASDYYECQLLVSFPTVLGRYGGIVTWMFSRWYHGGYFDSECAALEALFVVDGKLIKLIHYAGEHYDDGPPLLRERTGWHVAEGMDAEFDICQIQYTSAEAFCETKFGAAVWDSYVDFTGTSAEKTGLEQWIEDGRSWPTMYLTIWNEHNNVENLVKAGFGGVLEDIICSDLRQAAEYGIDPLKTVEFDFINWEKVRPHEMLGMRKEDLHSLTLRSWGRDIFTNYRRYTTAYPVTVEEFDEWRKLYSYKLSSLVYHDFELRKVTAYLKKQTVKTGLDLVLLAQLFMDYRDMLDDATTAVERFPPDIKSAHDRLAKDKKIKADRMTEEAFRGLHNKYAPLCWTDGELEILVPKLSSELAREGKTLHHCVGTYTQRHINGEPIFFVRHHRRPERSYFTLNIDMRGDKPREIQLHGYGNESKGSKSWKVPQKVRDFVDRWEREVLAPWFARQKAEENKKKKENKAA